MESQPSPRDITFIKIVDGYVIAANITTTVYMIKPMQSHINGNPASSNDETGNFQGELMAMWLNDIGKFKSLFFQNK